MMLMLMFSMAGVPPTVGFYAKLSVLQAVIDVDLVWLALAAVFFSVIGAFYYLRIVKLMYFDKPETEEPLQAAPICRSRSASTACCAGPGPVPRRSAGPLRQVLT